MPGFAPDPGLPPGVLRVPTPQSSPRFGEGHAPGAAFGVVPAPGCAAGAVPLPGACCPPGAAEVAAVAEPGIVDGAFDVEVPGVVAPGVVRREGIGISRVCPRNVG